MSDMNRSFAGSMPEFYDRILVPVMFEPFALDLAERLRGTRSGRVLEVAAGTGILTRALARLLPAEASITATDLNPAMLDCEIPSRARARAVAGGGRVGGAVRGSAIRLRRLPIRRHVLSRQARCVS
jgi:SAM-dependent methyltransferase